jgi:hypothetical protein
MPIQTGAKKPMFVAILLNLLRKSRVKMKDVKGSHSKQKMDGLMRRVSYPAFVDQGHGKEGKLSVVRCQCRSKKK